MKRVTQRPPTMAVELLSSSGFRGMSASGRSIAHLHAVSNGLWNDYRLMRCVARVGASDAVVQAALEDSFALHLGRLYVFLFSEEEAGDAVGAEDFLGARWYELRPPRSALLAAAVRWAERRVAAVPLSCHTSEERPGWTLVQASLELQRIMDPFVSNTPRALLGARWKVRYADGVTI